MAFDLVQAFASTESPFFLAGTNYTTATLSEAPQEISLRFSAGVRIDPSSLSTGITIVRSGGLADPFSNGNDVVIAPGFIGVDDLPNENRVIIRFAETLPNDSYRITIGASLKTLADGSATPVQMFRDGTAFNLNFNLNLGAQVMSVVPQPVIRPKTITFSAVPQDGDLLELAIRGGRRMFEFDSGNGVQGTNTAISIASATPTSLAASLATAINALSNASGFKDELNAASAGGATVTVSGVNFTPVVAFKRGDAVPALSPVVIGDNAALTQLTSKVIVYFNANDPLAAASVVPGAFKLFTLDSSTGVDSGSPITPSSVSYDATSASAVLTFATGAGGLDVGRLYRLQVGQSTVTAKADVTETDNANSTFSTSKDLGSLTAGALDRVSVKVTGAIDATASVPTPAGALSYPNQTGNGTEPGHRDIPSETHLIGTATAPGAITVKYFNFNDYYGDDVQGNVLHNAITETQKQRAREIFDLYSRYTGIRFIESETEPSAITVVTGDLRAVAPYYPRENLAGISNGSTLAVIDSSDDWGESEYGGGWFQVAMHEIGHSLGLGHAYDIPSIMGEVARLGAEGVYPGNYDNVHMNYLYPQVGTDIDLYKFTLTTSGKLTAQTFVARADSPVLSELDSVLTLYREDMVGGKAVRTLVARNDDYFGRDSFVGLDLQAGAYYIAVTSTGNTNFNPEIPDSGYGGRTDGTYELRVDFSPAASVTSPILDTTGTPLDGDRDGKPGGEYKFWFETAASTSDPATNNTLFVDKAAYPNFAAATTAGADGTLAKPFYRIQDAIAAANAGSIIRIVGNTGNAGSSNDERPYLIGTDLYGRVLEDGDSFVVPKGVTVMIDAGATLKLRTANIDVGSSSSLVDRSGAVLQVLGTPGEKVYFTSYHDDARGGDSDRFGPAVQGGQWGGIVFRGDSDFSKDRVLGTLGTSNNNDSVFLNSVSNASLRYGGGAVVVDGFEQNYAPLHLESTRPSLVFNSVTDSAGAPISADPNSFEDTAGRVGPEIRGNRLLDNSINGIFVRIRTELGKSLDKLSVPARFRNTDAPYVLTENLLIDGGAGGYVQDPNTGDVYARASGRLQVDPGVVIKLWRSRIELERGMAQFIAEGLPNNRVIFTTLADNRFGGGGTFDTNGANLDVRTAGDWGGIIVNAGAKASIDRAYIAYGGGETPIEGRFDNFSVVETHQGDLRLTNSRIELNAAQVATSDRDGRGGNDASTIFVRGALPIIVGNDFRSNTGAMISVNANSLIEAENPDWGRSTGPINRFTAYDDNRGPLVRGNVTSYASGSGAIAGMLVRGEEITVESVWDDTDIVHVLQNEIIVQNFHTATGVRLQSSPNASLVVKLLGANAGFTAAGYGLDIADRIGGTVQVVGFPTKPVILTSLKDDTVGASYDPLGRIVTDTNADGASTTAAAGDWRSLKFLPLSNDRNVTVVQEAESAYLATATTDNSKPSTGQVLGVLAPNFATGTNTWESAQEKSGDENRRLGFEVHGTIALDNSGDNDVYAFQGYSGSEVWFDIDKTSSALDSMIELLDASGNVIARSADAQTDGALNTSVIGAALPLMKDAWRGGDFYTTNPRDPGMRVILPTRAGYPLGTLTQYYVRVRSQPKYDATTSQPDYETALKATSAAALSAGASRGEYQLTIRLRQIDEKPGSTVRSADIRFPTTGIDVLGLPHNSQVLGETAEANVDANNVWTSAQKVGNLLAVDRNTISVGGELASAADVDWFTFNIDVTQTQSVAGVNGGQKTWSVVFDMDYADGFRGDLTISVFDKDGKLIYVGRDSDVKADQPGANQGNDFDDLSRGSIGKLDPFIGPIQMPTNAGRYYVAVSSNDQLPLDLNATFRSDATNTLVRMEPVNLLNRIVEDHIGSIGYKDSAKQQIDPMTGPLIGTTLRELGLAPTEATSVPPLTSTTTTTFKLAHTNVTPDSVNGTISYTDPVFGTTNRWTITTDATTGAVTIDAVGSILTSNAPLAMVVRGPAGEVVITWFAAVDPADVQLDEVTYLAAGVNPLSSYVTPFTLADVTLFLSTTTGLYTHDAVTGSRETTVNATSYGGLKIGDIDIRPDGKLYAYAGVTGNAGTAGQLMELDSGTGNSIAISPDAIPNVAGANATNFQTTSDVVTAMTFGRTAPSTYKDLWLVVADGGQSKLYLASNGGSATAAANATANQDKNSQLGYQGRIGIDLNNDGDFLDTGERPEVRGLQYIDDVSGTLYGVTADGKLLVIPTEITPGLKSADEKIDFDKRATVVADYAFDLAKVGATGFEALATAPQNLYGGALKGKLFALTNTGRLALLTPTSTTATSMAGQLGLLASTATTGGFLTVTGTTVATTLTGSRTGVETLGAGSATVNNKDLTNVDTSELYGNNVMLAFGKGIQANTLLDRIQSSSMVTLSKPATDTVTYLDSERLTFIYVSALRNLTTAVGAGADLVTTDINSLSVGMVAVGENLPTGTLIKEVIPAITGTGGQIRLSQEPLAAGTTTVRFIRPDVSREARTNLGSDSIQLATSRGIRKDMIVFGQGVPLNTRIVEITNQTIKLSNALTETSDATLLAFVDGRSVSGLTGASSLVPNMLVVDPQGATTTLRGSTTISEEVLDDSTVVLSKAAIQSRLGQSLRFIAPSVIDRPVTTVSGTTVTLDTTGLVGGGSNGGMYVLGTGVPDGTRIQTVNSDGTITLTNSVPSNTSTLTFYKDTAGDVIENVSAPELVQQGDLVFGSTVAYNTVVTQVDTFTQSLTLSKPATRAVPSAEYSVLKPGAEERKADLGNFVLGPGFANLSNTGLARGMVVIGEGIPEGTLIAGVNAGQIVLTQNVDQNASPSTLRFLTPDFTQSGAPSVRSFTITGLTSTIDLSVGMLVFGSGIPNNARIASKTASSITLDKQATAGNGTSLQQLAFFRDGRIVSGLTTTVDLAVGMSVTGDGIRSSTQIASIDTVNNAIRLSIGAEPTVRSNNSVTFGPGASTSTVFVRVVGALQSTAVVEALLAAGESVAVFGDGIASGTTVARIRDNSSLVLSKPFTGAAGNVPDLAFVATSKLSQPDVILTGNISSGLFQVTGLSRTSGLRVGMLVLNANLPFNTRVASIDGATSLTLTKAAAAGGTSETLKFINTSAFAYLADWQSEDQGFSPVLAGAAGATGIAFSPLDINLWHPTDRRGDTSVDSVPTPDPGHGINAAPDNSRGAAAGGTSMYFGLETWKESKTAYKVYAGQEGQYGVTAADWQRELTTNTGLGDTYNLPGGAYGSLTTNPFSLAGYSYTSKPTLYFNYWLDTQDASGTGAAMRDSARVFISKDNGVTWELIATNNQARGKTTELPSFPSVSSAISYDTRQQVQELFDTGKTTGWRQARIDLGNYANEPSLRLRFDFHTAGEFDPSRPDPSGAISGIAGTDGDFNSPERGQKNNYEGFYIDDILVGFAERGEMVTGAKGGVETIPAQTQGGAATTVDHSSFFDVGTPGPSGTVPAQYLMGPYQLEMRRGTEYGEITDPTKAGITITQTFDPAADFIRSAGRLGDENQPREQGQFIIEGNWIANAKTYGISIDAGDRDPDTGAPASGSPRKLPTLNNSRLAPGAVVVNNVISYSGTAGILFSGDKVTTLGAELITNGSFETTNPSLSIRGGEFATESGSTSLVGWNLTSGSIDIKRSGTLPAGSIWPAAAGEYFIDTSGTGPGVLQQTISTVVGETYTVRFSMAGNPGNAPRTKSLRVSAVGAATNAATFTQSTTPVVANQYQWEQKAWTFVADSASTIIRFQSLEQNEFGVFLDDVSVRQGIIAPLAAVPYGRIVNNTIYGGATQAGVGVQVTENAAPTLLNNLFSGLTTAIDVDSTSVNDGLGNLRTVIGTSAFHNVGTQVKGTTANQSLTLASNPFVAAQFANYYLTEGTPAIDSALNTLQDRSEYNVVTSPLGISVSPIVAPDRDIYGQLRGDDPKQASTPGLGSNIFKDRGAVDRIDFAAPYRTLVIPADSVRTVAVVRDDYDHVLTASGPTGRGVTKLQLQLADKGSGIDAASVVDPATLKVRSEAFVLLRGSQTLVAGTDYFVSYDPLQQVVTFEAVTVFAPDAYTLRAVTQKATATQVGLLTDRANNTLRPNNDDGTLDFSITFSDVPLTPTGLIASSGDAQVLLSWTATTSDGTPLLRYEVQRATNDAFTAGVTTNVLPTAVTLTDSPLVNGTQYWFRVRAVNAVGESDWSNVAGPVVPLSMPSFALASDTGVSSSDGITTNGLMNVTGILLGATWEFTTDGGLNWTAATGSTFTLPANATYPAGAVRVRQIAGGSRSGAFSNASAITVDTIAPIASAITAVTDDTPLINGPVADGGTTNDALLVLSGTTERGTAVEVFDGTTSLGNATVTGTTWTFATATLSDGTTYVFKTRATDLAGNVGPYSATHTVTVDTTPPTAPTITAVTDDVAPIVGNVTDGGATNDTVLVLTGTTDSGTTVEIFSGATKLGNATVIGTSWTYTTPTLINGTTYAFTARAADAAGNTISSASHTVTVDTTPPATPAITGALDDQPLITGNVPSGGVTNDTVLVLSGTTETNSTVEIFSGGTKVGDATVTGTSWSFTTATLSGGTTYTFTAKATDSAGNVGTLSAPYTVTIDTTPPAAPTITAVIDDVPLYTGPVANGGTTNDTVLVLSGTTESNTTVEIYNGATKLGNATVTGTTWTYTTPTLSDGSTYAFKAVAADAAGNVGPDSTIFTVTVDTTPPTAPAITAVTDDVAPVVGNVSDGGATNDTILVLSGTTESGTSVEIYSGATKLGDATVTGTNWSFTTPTLTNGTTYAFKARAIDAVGNTSGDSPTRRVTIDTTPPAAPGITGVTDDVAPIVGNVANGGRTNDNVLVLSGTTEAGATVEILSGATTLGNATVIGTAWSFTTASLSEGTYAFRAVATDAAGNVGPNSSSYTVTVDTTPPTAPTITAVMDDVPLYTGPVADGGTTNDTVLVLSGTTESGTNVEIYNGATKLGNATVTGTAWTYTTPTLRNGTTYALKAIATDGAGNVGPASANHTITIDTTPPAVPTITAITDDVPLYTGPVADGGVTNDTVLVLSGTTEANTTVEIFNGATKLGDATVTGTNWSFTTATLTSGTTYVFTARAADAAGNTISSASQTITVDTTPPVAPTITGVTDDVAPVVGNVVNGGTTNDTVLFLSGTTESNTTVEIYNGVTKLGNATVTGSTWTFTTPTLSDGTTYAFKAVATDAAGNVGPDSSTYTVTVDTTPPNAPTITAVTDDIAPVVGNVSDGGTTNDTVLVLNGTTESGTTVEIYSGATKLGNATVTGTNWSFTTPTLTNGTTYVFKARAIDAVGNTSGDSPTRRVTIDTTPPAAPFITGVTDDVAPITGNVANGGQTNDPVLVLTGTTEAGAMVEIFNGVTKLGNATVIGTGWSFTTALLSDGTYAFKAIATDAAGNISPESSTYTVTVDTTPPDPPSITGNNRNFALVRSLVSSATITNTTTPTLSGTAEAGSVITVRRNGATIGTATANGSGLWTLTTPVLANGTHTFTATATDAAGNTSSGSVDYVVTVDTVAPLAPVIVSVIDDKPNFVGIVARGQSTNDNELQLTGTAEPGATVSVWSGATMVGSAIADGSGNWGFTTPRLADGAYSLTATATDAAGNTSPVSSPAYAVTVDTVAPARAAISSVIDDVGTIVGSVPFGGRTDDTTLLVTGTAEPGSLVVVRSDTTILRRVYTDVFGNWSVTTPVLAAQAHKLNAYARDAAGNVGVKSPNYTITVDTTAPTILAFGTTATANTFGPGADIPIYADASERLLAGSAINVTLNTGAVVWLTTATIGSRLTGTYRVVPGALASPLAIVAAATATPIAADIAGNPLASLPGVPFNLAGINVEAAIRAVATGFSSDPTLPSIRTASVTSMPIVFSTDVTGVSIASFLLFYEQRDSLSLRGATITGSGRNYTLTLPSNLTSRLGSYRLVIGPSSAIRAVDGNAPMNLESNVYWNQT